MIRRVAGSGDAADLLRRGLIGLAGVGIAGTALELAFLGHWDGALQLVAWAGVGVLGLGFTALLRTRSASALRVVRIAALAAATVGVVGVLIHLNANLDSATLDRKYGDIWESLPFLEQLWLAGTGQVGPAPTLAPGALAQTALAVLLATVRHPATGR